MKKDWFKIQSGFSLNPLSFFANTSFKLSLETLKVLCEFLLETIEKKWYVFRKLIFNVMKSVLKENKFLVLQKLDSLQKVIFIAKY